MITVLVLLQIINRLNWSRKSVSSGRKTRYVTSWNCERKTVKAF